MNNPELSSSEEQQDPLEGGAEVYDQKIVAHNLNMLQTDMLSLLSGESIGGNAGSVEIDGKRYPCVVANGCADAKTGEIVAFGNFQNIDPKILKNNQEIAFRVSFYNGKIIDFYGKEKIAKGVVGNIEKAIEEYNLIQGDA